jgi:hypothetical protein
MATNERPSRLVVGLGIATVILFSANLLAMLSQRVWPQLHDALSETSEEVDAAAPEIVFEHGTPFGATVHISHPSSEHTVYRIRRDSRGEKSVDHHHAFQISPFGAEKLDLEIAALERNIEREMNRLNGEVGDVERDLDGAISLRLHVDGVEKLRAEKEDHLAGMELKLEAIAKSFEARVEMHEAAARLKEAGRVQRVVEGSPRVIVRER